MKTRILEPADNAHSGQLLIRNLLLSGLRYAPDKEIVYGEHLRYNYTTLGERICRLANVLSHAGIGAGDTVAVLDWDSHRYLEAYFAVPMIGAVLHHVNIRLSPDQIAYTMNHAEDDLVLIHDDFVAVAEHIAAQIPSIKGYIQLTENDQPVSTSLNTLGDYESLLADASPQYDFQEFDENSVATTFYTTGTTGNPKGVYFSHRQLVLHSMAMSHALASQEGQPMLRSDDVYMPMTPMFHVHAWGVPYVATMMGVKQVYPGRYVPDNIVRLYRNEGVTFSHGVPAVLQMVLGCEEAQDTDLRGWKMLTGGSAPTTGLSQQMIERGIEFFTAYGMSESCPILTVVQLSAEERALPPEQQAAARVRTGMPIAMVDMKIVDPDGNALPHDGAAMGEVVVRTPWLTGGYYKEPEKSNELWQNGWLHTGDVGTIDANGVLQIRDRIKDVIKTGGEWVSSLALESMISQHPAVAEVAVVGIPDERWDERPCALVVATAAQALDATTIQQHLQHYVDQGQINKWAIPEQISIVTEIPKTSVGKINKKLIRQQLT
ncbi:MAG: fatty acid--CoA ligase [Marinobacterium sp.]|nr:fatty acid--CoA ligase [Marinobacterium sp.]